MVRSKIAAAAAVASGFRRGSRAVAAALAVGLAAGTGAARAADGSLLDALSARFPLPDARGVCADASLRLAFRAPVSIGTSGEIRVFRAADPTQPVDAIRIDAPSFQDQIGGRKFRQVRPIFSDGNEVSIYLHQHALQPDETYFVTVDAGVFTDAQGRPLGGIADSRQWRFTTRAAAPAPDQLVVARDGSGDFCSVQGAIDFVPAGNREPTRIAIRNGTYHEIVFISGRSNLTLRGEDRRRTVISYPNNDGLQAGMGTRFRPMVNAENSNDLVFENLTLHNTTPQGGLQAEALRIAGGDRVILRNADFRSLQDTVMVSGRVYAVNSTIEGNVDFLWGEGTAYLENCEIKTVGRRGVIVMARNTSKPGFVFVDSAITADPGIKNSLLARIEVDRFPMSQVAFIDCRFADHIDPRGWEIRNATAGNSANLRFLEFRSTDLAGRLLDVSRRDPLSHQLQAAEAARLRDKRAVLGGWDPS